MRHHARIVAAGSAKIIVNNTPSAAAFIPVPIGPNQAVLASARGQFGIQPPFDAGPLYHTVARQREGGFDLIISEYSNVACSAEVPMDWFIVETGQLTGVNGNVKGDAEVTSRFLAQDSPQVNGHVRAKTIRVDKGMYAEELFVKKIVLVDLDGKTPRGQYLVNNDGVAVLEIWDSEHKHRASLTVANSGASIACTKEGSSRIVIMSTQKEWGWPQGQLLMRNDKGDIHTLRDEEKSRPNLFAAE